MPQSKRGITIGINVDDAAELPKVGAYLAKFIERVDIPHGPFDIAVTLSVAPVEDSAIGPFKLEGEPEPPTLVFLDGPGDYEVEGAD